MSGAEDETFSRTLYQEALEAMLEEDEGRAYGLVAELWPHERLALARASALLSALSVQLYS